MNILNVKGKKDIYFDTESQNYKYIKSNRPVKDAELRKRIKQHLKTVAIENTELTKKLLNNEISFRAWQLQMIELIKNNHVASFRAGSGNNNPNSRQWLLVANQLRNQEYKYWKVFVNQIASSKLTEGEIVARTIGYIKAAKNSFELGLKEQKEAKGHYWAKRHLGSCKPHCLPCLGYAEIGVVPISQLILPGQACDCGFNCCCGYETAATPKELSM